MACPYCVNNDGVCQNRCVTSQQVPLRAADRQHVEKLTPEAREKFELQILEKRAK